MFKNGLSHYGIVIFSNVNAATVLQLLVHQVNKDRDGFTLYTALIAFRAV